jgi:hypothetical protein
MNRKNMKNKHRRSGMKEKISKMLKILIILIFIVSVPSWACAKDDIQQWELINPAGVVLSEPVKFAARPSTLEGKTIVLRWNAKPNGNVLLNRVEELLVQNIKGVKVIKAWEVAPETRVISYGHATSLAVAKKLASFKPDLVIGAPAD